jgi:carotenoid cleavage dioxygenase
LPGGRCSQNALTQTGANPSTVGVDSGVANTNIVSHADRLLALAGAHRPFELDPITLESRGYVEQYRGRVTAHPKLDPATGEMIWFGYSVGDRPFSNTVSYRVTDAEGRVMRRDDFEANFSSIAHDFLAGR